MYFSIKGDGRKRRRRKKAEIEAERGFYFFEIFYARINVHPKSSFVPDIFLETVKLQMIYLNSRSSTNAGFHGFAE